MRGWEFNNGNLSEGSEGEGKEIMRKVEVEEEEVCLFCISINVCSFKVI